MLTVDSFTATSRPYFHFRSALPLIALRLSSTVLLSWPSTPALNCALVFVVLSGEYADFMGLTLEMSIMNLRFQDRPMGISKLAQESGWLGSTTIIWESRELFAVWGCLDSMARQEYSLTLSRPYMTTLEESVIGAWCFGQEQWRDHST